MVKRVYGKLKKDHPSLPDFEVLDDEFEISTCDKEFLLRNIKKKIEEKLTFLSSILSDIVQPSPDSFESMYECSYFTAEDKEELVTILKAIQFHLRSVAESNIILKDHHDMDVITAITNEFPQLRKQALPHVTKLKEIWKRKADAKEVLEYFG